MEEALLCLTGKSLIGEGFVDVDRSSTTFRAFNPRDGQQMEPPYYAASTDQVDEAASLATEASPRYRDLPNSRRAEFLRAIAESLENRSEMFVSRTGQETALPEPRIRGELARTANQLRMFADIVAEGSWVDARIDPAVPDRTPLPRPDCRSMLRPLGPVAVFGASNFPLAFSAAGGDTAAALAAGCPVIVKAHSAHPGTGELAGQAILEAARAMQMPPGVFSLVFGSGTHVGVALVQHPLIKAVGFTGSYHGGMTLYDLAVSRDEPIPVHAEMGSVNPIFLLPQALATRNEAIAKSLHQSAMLGVGQFCTNPGLVLYDGNKDFRNHLIRLYSDSRPACMLTEKIANTYHLAVEELCDTAEVEQLMARRDELHHAYVNAALMEVEAASLMEDMSLSQEVFGPFTMLVRYEDEHQVHAIARSLQGQLTASIHATEQDLVDFYPLPTILEEKAGRIIFNQFPTGVEVGYAMVHGGPFPATTESRHTSVGATAINRFARPVCFQNCPLDALPLALRDDNPLGLRRLINGKPESPTNTPVHP